MVSPVFVAIAFGILAVYWWLKRKEPSNPLPEPSGSLPIIGHLLQMKSAYGKNHLVYNKWAVQFPAIFQIKLVTTRVIIMSDHNAVKELLSQETFSGRSGLGIKFFDMYNDGEYHGIIQTEGKEGEQIRNFTIRHLREFGFGKTSMEEIIMEEVKELMDWMKSQDGRPISGIKDKLVIAVVNSLWSIITGSRYKHDDPVLLDLTERLQTSITKIAETGGLLIFAPWLRYIIPERSGFNFIRKIIEDLKVFFTKAVSEHKRTLQEDQPRDFIDAFLNEVKRAKDPKSPFSGALGERHLVGCISDLFSNGSDTTSTTLAWTMLYLTTFPEIQEKFQKEIQAVVGNTRYCTLADRANMPYTKALIAEVMRSSSILPMGVHHSSLKPNAQFRGYTIPMNAMILTNLYFIHHNPEVWGDPETFRPSRFLSADGKTFVKHEALMPFSVGKRQCLGESLANDTVFLFATNIFQRFDVILDPSEPNPGLEPAVGLMLNPKPFKVILKDRLE